MAWPNWRAARVVLAEAIPMLATGKTDYVSVQKAGGTRRPVLGYLAHSTRTSHETLLFPRRLFAGGPYRGGRRRPCPGAGKGRSQDPQTESGEDFQAINPKGYVPALGLDDGSLLTENGAILPFLGDKSGPMPKDGHGRYHALEWIGFINSELHKSFAPLFHGAPDDQKAKAKEKILGRLKLVEDRLTGDYLMGGGFTPPDAYLYVILRWCEKMDIDVSGLPRLTAFKARMEARAGVQKALKEEGLA